MRRIYFGMGIVALVSALLIWAASLAIAEEHGHAEHGHVDFGHAAGVGSVHFAPHAGPVVRTEEHAVRGAEHAVRGAEHVAAEVAHAAFRNPYRDEYFRRFPPGYRPFMFNGAQYYGYYSPPLGYQQVVVNGVVYYLFNGVYYQPYMYGGQTVYLVVPPPV